MRSSDVQVAGKHCFDILGAGEQDRLVVDDGFGAIDGSGGERVVPLYGGCSTDDECSGGAARLVGECAPVKPEIQSRLSAGKRPDLMPSTSAARVMRSRSSALMRRLTRDLRVRSVG